MNIIKVECLPLSIFVGYERENDARGVAFDYSAWTEQYGDGVLQLLVQRPGDADPYPVVLTAGEDGTAVWSPSATDTAAKGWVEIQLIFMVGSVVAKTAVLQALVDRSLTAGSTPPDPYETWLETLTQLAEQILHTTQPPEIRNGYWYTFDPDTGEYVNSGVKAEGEDGVGITGAQLNADYTLTLSFSDGTSYTTPSIRGAQGEVGPTPQLSVGTVTTGAAGSSAAVEISGTPEAPVLNFTIPRGDTGEVSESELQVALLEKADVITDTASGAIASFPDGAAAPVKALTVAVEPVQNLNGYDAPWPAGGGKNKLNLSRTVGTPIPIDILASPRALSVDKYYVGLRSDNYYYTPYISNYSVTDTVVKVTTTNNIRYGVAFPVSCSANTTYSLSATLTEAQLSVGCYDSSWNFLGEIFGPQGPSDVPKTFTTPNEAAYLTIIVSSLVVGEEGTATNIQLELGSPATAWTPYSNFCPISGVSAVELEQTGKNLLDSTRQIDATARTVADMLSAYKASGVYGKGYYNGTAIDTNAQYWTTFTPCKAGVTYTIKNTVDTFSRVCFLDDDGNVITTSSAWPTSYTHTALSNEKYIMASFKVADADYVMLNVGSTAEPYSAFVGTPHIFQLGQTVYGCTIYPLLGKAIVDRVYSLLNDPDKWLVSSSSSANFEYSTVFSDAKNTGNSYDGLSCSYVPVRYGAEPYGRWFGATNHKFGIKWVGGTLADIRADAVNGKIAIRYTIATPFEISITPEEIETLKGTNNFWSDAGDVSVEYRADTKLYIEKKIAAAIAAALNS